MKCNFGRNALIFGFVLSFCSFVGFGGNCVLNVIARFSCFELWELVDRILTIGNSAFDDFEKQEHVVKTLVEGLHVFESK